MIVRKRQLILLSWDQHWEQYGVFLEIILILEIKDSEHKKSKENIIKIFLVMLLQLTMAMCRRNGGRVRMTL